MGKNPYYLTERLFDRLSKLYSELRCRHCGELLKVVDRIGRLK